MLDAGIVASAAPQRLLRLAAIEPNGRLTDCRKSQRDVGAASWHNRALADVGAARPRVRSRPMKTLLKLALAGALAAVLVRWARDWLDEAWDDFPTVNPVRDAEPTAAEPLREEDLRVAQNSPF